LQRTELRIGKPVEWEQFGPTARLQKESEMPTDIVPTDGQFALADAELLERFLPHLKALPERRELLREDVLTSTFLLHAEGILEIYYAPFHSINRAARVTLIGITPGWSQAEIQLRLTRKHLLQGATPLEAVSHADREASFAGAMRRNASKMLGEVRLPHYLGITPDELFSVQNAGLLNMTSAVRYPVFVKKGETRDNYTGYSPTLTKTPLLRNYVLNKLSEELRHVPRSIIVPFGRAVSDALTILIDEGVARAEQCLLGFPHPAGSNGHRASHFERAKLEMMDKVKAWFEKSEA
jgi:hypothetical protein